MAFELDEDAIAYLTDKEFEAYCNILKIEAASKDFRSFVEYTMPNYEFNWHHEAIIDRLNKLVHQKNQRLLITMPPRHGKQCADSTPILTTSGWKTHGELEVGDYVYSPEGKAIKVLAISEPTECNAVVTVSNGEEIYCHLNHEWTVYDRSTSSWKTLETKQMLGKEVSGSRARYMLPTIHSLEGEDLALPTALDRKKVTRLAKRRKLSIRSIEAVTSSEIGRCIQVDSENGLYLVGASLVPTHNSELASRRFPAFLLGINPNARIIACSYSAGLATTFNRDVQRILESDSFAEVFPDCMIPGTELAKAHPDNKKYKKQAAFFEIIDHSGFLLSTGVEGSITGLGADLLLIDDPIKNEEEASSETIRESVFAWYNSTAYTRLEGGANIILILTRWHKGDLAGKLLEEAEVGGEKWEVINFPAISTASVAPPDPRKEGEALWPGKYDLERLEIIKRQVGTRVWSSLYQQNPTVEGGNIVKEEWFQYYHKLPFDINNWREAYLVNSWDVSFKKTGKSYNVGVVIAKHKADFYLIDMWRQRAGIVEVKNAVKKLYEKYPSCKTVLIEGKANGPAIIQLLKKQVSNLVEVNPGTSKDERLEAIAPIIEAGNFYLPYNSPISKLVVEEMTSFPNADNDDIVDAISQGLIRFMEMRGLRHLQAITKW